jgi:hypothetical protein
MSANHYDPWMHAMHVFLNRVVLFLVLSLAIGLAWWAGVLRVVFGVAWSTMPSGTWALAKGQVEMIWRVGLGEAGVIGAVLTAWLFTFLVMRGRLRRGDRHHRGARVVDADSE